MRAWDNRGGTITSWAEALSEPTVPRGSSALFTPTFPLRIPGPPGPGAPGLAGLQSFNLFVPIPEPSSIALFALTGVGILFGRLAKRR